MSGFSPRTYTDKLPHWLHNSETRIANIYFDKLRYNPLQFYDFSVLTLVAGTRHAWSWTTCRSPPTCPTVLSVIRYQIVQIRKKVTHRWQSENLCVLKVLFWRQCWGSVTFWCGSGSADPYLWLMDPDPYPTLDPTSFFSDFKDAKKNIF
jgi:hypothetical protein